MNTVFQKNKALKFILIFTLIAFIFSSCSINKYGEKKVLSLKNWVNWRLKFKENASEDDQAKVMLSIDSYILEYLYKQKPVGSKVSYINISHTRINPAGKEFLIEAQVGLGGEVQQPAIAGPHPGGPGPRFPAGLVESLGE